MPFGRVSTSIRCLHASDDTRALGGCHLFVVVTTRKRTEIKFEIFIFMAISLPTTLCKMQMPELNVIKVDKRNCNR